MRAAGVRGDLDDFVQMHAVGIEPELRRASPHAPGVDVSDVDELVQLRHWAGPQPPIHQAAEPRREAAAGSPPHGSDPDDG